ncbi:hypothetical protein LCI18_006511 [Fusarium solani-melongenae]|uniref:Uncharacterized protein n=1 Tax=Fusarium solani subsp. cucurbitae TaxID=2747967 RepID=A0ACD3Z311_FUSSC|nr:hypothetical protein LCI18_006511 [Fusarium solani-melongenae]
MLLKELTVSVAWERLQHDWRASIHLPIIIAASFLLIIVFYSLRSLYRIHLHPLSKFPGPREAAKSDLWLYHQSLSTFPEATFEELHQKYQAKAIRIAPNELHIADTRLYKAIYKQSNPFPKHEAFYLGFNAPSPSVFTEVDQSKHKERRRMLSPMFSRAGVLKLEDLVRERLMLLENKVDRLCEKQKIDVYDALRCHATAVSFTSCANWQDAGLACQDDQPRYRKFLGLDPGKFNIPFIRQKLKIEKQFSTTCVERWRRTRGKRTAIEHPIVVDNLETLDNKALVGEAVDLLVAGSDTSATSMAVAVLEIISHPSIEKRLVEELDAAIPDKDNLPSIKSLENIPYLTACVKEGIRFAAAVPGRLPRVVPNNVSTPFIVDDKVVPPGVCSIDGFRAR